MKSSQTKLLAELGIPEEVAHLSPESCTCGKADCSKHQTWGDLLLERLFADSADTGERPLIDLEAQIEMLKNYKFPERE